ncbi:MAG: tail fiber domain-containing protein [Crocinitomicaceae bacterium]|nr:tail fiber domain-containing protein [Crocinitomicaceae bacterium]
MKKTLLALIASMAIILSFGQSPEAFKYQAVVRDAGNTILNNQSVGMQLTILQTSPTGTAVYTETFATSTNAYGLVNIEIGTGTTTDDFSLIDWANGPYFIETAVDVTGGTSYSVMGTSQLMSVPYALYAQSAESVANDMVDDADADPANEIQVVSFSNDTLYLSNGGSVYLGDYAIDNVDDADSDPTNELQDWATLPNIPAGFADDIDNVDDADADPTNELQDLDLSNDVLLITGGNSVDLSAYINTDNQTLSYNAGSSTLTISGGNSVAVPNGDVTGVAAGAGLTGGGNNGAITLTANANNGLNVDGLADAIQLGGALTENTTITQGAYSLNYNLTSTGDFNVQDAGVTHFSVQDNGLTYFGDDSYWRDGSTSGTALVSITDDGDDGRFQVLENGITSVDLDANSQFVFNEQGLDRNFRVESDISAFGFFMDAGLNRIGLGTGSPLARLHVTGGAIMPEPGLASGIHWPANFYGGGGDDPYIAYISQVGENTTLQIANQNDWDDDISFYQFDAERMTIYDGNVGIANTIPSYDLHLGTNSAAKPTSNVWTVASDRRLKENIRPYTSGLEDLLKINTVWFTYTGEAGMPKDTGVGVIAQELQEIAPYMVNSWEYHEENGDRTEYLGVDNGAMTYMLINAVKEQQTEIDELKQMVLDLKNIIEKDND